MARIICGVPISTVLPKALCSKYAFTFGANAANWEGSFTLSAIRRA